MNSASEVEEVEREPFHERDLVKEADALNRPVSIKAWRHAGWLTPRRMFYIIMLVLLLISLILLIVAVSITSSAYNPNTIPYVPAPLESTTSWITAPAQLSQGSMMFSSDYSYALVFSDDLYLMDWTNKKILWSANANIAGNLAYTPSSDKLSASTSGATLSGTLQFQPDGSLSVVDGTGVLRWSNYQSFTPLSSTDPWVLVVTPQGSLQIQSRSSAQVQNYLPAVWTVNASTDNVVPSVTSLKGPFATYPGSFVLRSDNGAYLGQFANNGQFTVYASDGSIVFQTNFNPAVPSPRTPFIMQLSCVGTLSIIDACRSTIWDSHSGNYLSDAILNSTYTLQINSTNGNLEITNGSAVIWNSSQNVTWTANSPLGATSDFILTSTDGSLQVQFSHTATQGDLQLVDVTRNTITSLSETRGQGTTLTFQNNGLFSIQNQDGADIYTVSSGFAPVTCASDQGLPVTLAVVNNKFQAFANIPASTACSQAGNGSSLWSLPFLSSDILQQLPAQIASADQDLPWIDYAGIAYFLRSSNNLYVAGIDFSKGQFKVVQANSGALVQSQNLLFSPLGATGNASLRFTAKGLFLIRNTVSVIGSNLTGQSSFNSGTAILDANSSLSFTLSIADEDGILRIFRNDQPTVPIWAANQLAPAFWSVSSSISVIPSQSAPSGQSQVFQTLNLFSPSQTYQATFGSSGNLLLIRVADEAILWSSQTDTEGANLPLVLSANGDLSIGSSFQLQARITSSSELPVTLWVSDFGNLNLSTFTNRVIWSISGETPSEPATLSSPQQWAMSSATANDQILMLSNPGLASLQWKSPGYLAIFQMSQGVAINPPLWTMPLPSNFSFSTLTYPLKLEFQNSGNFILYDSSSPPFTVWASNTANYYDPDPPYVLTLDTSGNLTISSSHQYSNLNPLWSNLSPISYSLSSLSVFDRSSQLWNPSRSGVVSLGANPSCVDPNNSTFVYGSQTPSTPSSSSSTVTLSYTPNSEAVLTLQASSSSSCILLNSKVPVSQIVGPITLTLPNYPNASSSVPFLMVNDNLGNLLGTWPYTDFQLPSQVCVGDSTVTAAAGIQLVNPSSNSFLSFSAESQQLLFRNGTPTHPSLQASYFTSPQLTNRDLYLFFMGSVGALVLGYINDTGDIQPTWSNQAGKTLRTGSGERMLLSLPSSTEFQTSLTDNDCQTIYHPIWISNTSSASSNRNLLISGNTDTTNNNLVNSYDNPTQVSFSLSSTTSQRLLSSPEVWSGPCFLNGNRVTVTNGFLPNLLLVSNQNVTLWSLSSSFVVLENGVTRTFSSSSTAQLSLTSKGQLVLRASGTDGILYQVYVSPLPSTTTPGTLSALIPSIDYDSSTNVILIMKANQEVLFRRPVPPSTQVLPALPWTQTTFNSNLQTSLTGQATSNSFLTFTENGNMVVRNPNSMPVTIVYQTASQYLNNPYYNFNANQLLFSTIFPCPSFRAYLTNSGNLVIRDGNNFVLFCSGTAVYDQSVPNLNRITLTNCVNTSSNPANCVSLSLTAPYDAQPDSFCKSPAGTINYWTRGINVNVDPNVLTLPFWSLSSPCSLSTNGSQVNTAGRPMFPIRSNVQTSLLGNFYSWILSQPCLNLTPAGDLQVVTQSILSLSSTNPVPVLICNAVLWSCLQDGFYQSESPGQFPHYGQTNSSSSDSATLALGSDGQLQVFGGSYPSQPSLNQSLLFSIPANAQKPAPYEVSVRTAGMMLTYPRGASSPFFDNAFRGYVCCGQEADPTSLVWQLPPVTYPLTPPNNTLVFPLPSEDYFTEIPAATTSSQVPLLTSANGYYHLLFQVGVNAVTGFKETQLGIVKGSIFTGQIVNAADFEWYFPLVESYFMNLTSRGNCVITQNRVQITTGASNMYSNLVMFQTYTGHYSAPSSLVPFRFLLRNSGRLELQDALENILWTSPSATYQGPADPSLLSIGLPPRFSYTFNAVTKDTNLNQQNGSKYALQDSGIQWPVADFCPGIFLWTFSGTAVAFPNDNGSMQIQVGNRTGSTQQYPTGTSTVVNKDSYFYLETKQSPEKGGVIAINQGDTSWSPTWTVPLNLTSSTTLYPPFTLTLTSGIDGCGISVPVNFALQDMHYTTVPVTPPSGVPWTSAV